MESIRPFTISVFSENTPGVLQRISVMFTRRKLNIESLTVSETERKGISRFTIVINATEDLITKVAKQLSRIIEVSDVYVAENKDLVFKEVALIKVSTEKPEHRAQIEEFAHHHGAQLAYINGESVIVEKTGTEDDITSLYLLLQPFGIKAFVRSGRIAVLKEKANKIF